jgi:hypothetical protein
VRASGCALLRLGCGSGASASAASAQPAAVAAFTAETAETATQPAAAAAKPAAGAASASWQLCVRRWGERDALRRLLRLLHLAWRPRVEEQQRLEQRGCGHPHELQKILWFDVEQYDRAKQGDADKQQFSRHDPQLDIHLDCELHQPQRLFIHDWRWYQQQRYQR